MVLSYDFDIKFIVPREMMNDPANEEFVGETGFEDNARRNFVALFRDQATVDALCGADPVVQGFFLKSGFGMNVCDSGAGAGCYPDADEDFRQDVITRLAENLAEVDLEGANFNGFNLADFLETMDEAEPVDHDAVVVEAYQAASEMTAGDVVALETTRKRLFGPGILTLVAAGLLVGVGSKFVPVDTGVVMAFLN